MELFLLLMAVPLIWLLMLPVRAMGKVQQHPFKTAGILSLLGFGAFVALLGLKPGAPAPEVPAALVAQHAPVERPADYAAGDTALRALLE